MFANMEHYLDAAQFAEIQPPLLIAVPILDHGGALSGSAGESEPDRAVFWSHQGARRSAEAGRAA